MSEPSNALSRVSDIRALDGRETCDNGLVCCDEKELDSIQYTTDFFRGIHT
jgi:hypothetical protein